MAALEGLKVLSRSLGEQDPAIALAQLQKKLLEEEQRNRELAAADPKHFSTGATATGVEGLKSDLAANPYGDEAVARRHKVDEDIATANRPDVREIAGRELAAKLALAAAPAEAQARGSLEMQKQKQAGSAALWDKLRGDRGGMDTPMSEPRISVGSDGDISASFAPQKLSAGESASLQSFAKAQPIIKELQTKLGTPKDDFWSQLSSGAANRTSKFLYSQGFKTEDNTIQQLEGLLSVVGSSPYATGSRSFEMIKRAMEHLTSGRGTDAFNKAQLDEIQTLWPQMVSEMKAQHENPYGLAGAK